MSDSANNWGWYNIVPRVGMRVMMRPGHQFSHQSQGTSGTIYAISTGGPFSGHPKGSLPLSITWDCGHSNAYHAVHVSPYLLDNQSSIGLLRVLPELENISL